MKIEMKNVDKRFKKNSILSNVNVTFESGNIYGLYGRNGSGKSVFLKLLCGFYIPSNGEILYDGVNLNAKNEFPKDLRALIEKPSFFPDLTGFQNLKLLADITNKITDDDIIDALEIVNLVSEKDKKYSKYSLGMKQKLGIAQVIMENPQVMILDEPFNGIESKTVETLIEWLKSKQNENKIIIVSTHIKDDLEKLTSKILFFDNGFIKEYEES